MASDQEIFDLIRKSSGYTDPNPKGINQQDRNKVDKALRGEPSNKPSSYIAQAAWYLAKRIAPPPPPTAKLVAPITVREEGGSDQRVCLFNTDGTLRPGVTRLPSGEYTDESGAKYNSNGDGLENSSVRTKVHDPALVGAKQMDGRSACECPTVGSPSNNTGSWTV